MRVALKTKNKKGKATCNRCGKAIKPGDKYFTWKHRYSPASKRHESCGRPRTSELCTGKMSGVYGAVESVEDAISGLDRSDLESVCNSLSSALNDAAGEVGNVKDEYESSLSNMPDSLQSSSSGDAIQEKIDGLDNFITELEDAANEIEGMQNDLDEEPEFPEEPTEDQQQEHDQWETDREAKIDEAVSRAEDALQNLSV